MKICDIDISKEGNMFVATVFHHRPPFGDRRLELTYKFTNARIEDLMCEVHKYLDDCYDEEL
jgi:hypothetical protein